MSNKANSIMLLAGILSILTPAAVRGQPAKYVPHHYSIIQKAVDTGGLGDTMSIVDGTYLSLNWKTSEPWDQCSEGPIDLLGKYWHEKDFDDSSWQDITIPNIDSFSNGNDRFYRAEFNIAELAKSEIWFQSDDGIWIYVNGDFVGHWGSECGGGCCVNCADCGSNEVVPPVDITSYLHEGDNVIAVMVNNGYCCNSYFNMNLATAEPFGEAEMLNYYINFLRMAEWLATQQQADGGVQEAEDYSLTITDNTTESIWTWSCYAEITGDYTTYLQNIDNAWDFCYANPSWEEFCSDWLGQRYFCYYTVYNVGWGLLAEMKYREVYEDRPEYIDHTWYGEQCANTLVNYAPGTGDTISALCLGLAAGALHQYGVSVSKPTYCLRAAELGNSVRQWLELDVSRFSSEDWAVSGGIAVWGVLNSYYQENSGGDTWAQEFAVYMPTDAHDGLNNDYQYGHDGWYAWGHYAVSSVLDSPYYSQNYRNIIDYLLSVDGDNDGGMPQGPTYTDNQDFAWVTNVATFALNLGVKLAPPRIFPYEAAELAKQVIGAPYLGDGKKYGGKGYNCWSCPPQRFVHPNEIKTSGYCYYDGRIKTCNAEKAAGVDCSGLVFWAYNRAYLGNKELTGEDIKNTPIPFYCDGAACQYTDRHSYKIEKEELLPGDLLFFVGHVAMYVGEDKVIHSEGVLFKEIVEENLETVLSRYYDYFKGFRRVKDSEKPEILILGKSPIDIVVTDPDGRTITKELWEAPGMYYREYDIDGDGEPDDMVAIPSRKVGTYSITVVSEPNALPTDTYSLEATIDGQTMVLAEDVQIEDIPAEGYEFKLRLNRSDFDNDGDVDLTDLATLCLHWLEQDCNCSNWCGGTDLNYSEQVDFVDFVIFAANWLWEKIPADIDIDGDVDFSDYAVFADHWMDVDCNEPSWCCGTDLNKRGQVDIFDLRIFAEHWLEGTIP